MIEISIVWNDNNICIYYAFSILFVFFQLQSQISMVKSICFITYVMVLLSYYTKSLIGTRLIVRATHLKRLSCHITSCPREEYIISSVNNNYPVDILGSNRSNVCFLSSDDERMNPTESIWTAFCNNIQLDSTLLEEHFLGKVKSTDLDVAYLWESKINDRLEQKLSSSGISASFKAELDVAIPVVQRAAFVIRSLQGILLNSVLDHPINQALRSTSYSLSSSKVDSTPVTVADFAIQALVIDTLHRAFPKDLFIAEEDSSIVRADPAICQAVLIILRAATGFEWSSEKLFSVLDKGSFGSSTHAPLRSTSLPKQRVWVLDPVDGTKGFMRGEHCCTGLGLLVDGVTQLSVLGCPNLNLLRLLQGSGYDDKDISYIDPPISVSSILKHSPTIFHPHSGSVYFAVTDQGAFARSLSMPLGAAFEVTTSGVADSQHARLCESAEALFGDREVTARTGEELGVKKEYLRIDGMCKHCVVGVGAAEATLRLPPAGYREKIWDHVAGDHFVREAGGRVTDLDGARLDFTAVMRVGSATSRANGGNGAVSGRELGAEVQGIVISNGMLHTKIVDTINAVRDTLRRK